MKKVFLEILQNSQENTCARENSYERETKMFSQFSPSYASLAVFFPCTVNKELHEDTVVFKNKRSQKFCKFQWKTPVLQAFRPATLLKRGSNKSDFL